MLRLITSCTLTLLLGCAHSPDEPSQARTIEVPVVAPEGVDPWGRPLVTADKLALRRLLREKRFDELTRIMEEIQNRVEADCSLELMILDGFEAFTTAEEDLRPLYDAWVAHNPGSFAPYLARALYFRALAWTRRGGDWAHNTSREQWQGMADALSLSDLDLAQSLKLRDSLPARRAQMKRRPAQSAFEQGLRLCPDSVMLRTAYIAGLTPRWGGSYAAMKAFSDAAPVERVPKLKILGGYAEHDLCRLRVAERQFEQALQHCEAALRVGPYWEFLYLKAWVLLELKRNTEALTALDEALRQRPQKNRVLVARARTLAYLDRWDEAAESIATARALDAEGHFVRGFWPWFANHLTSRAVHAIKDHPADARRDLERVLKVDPNHRRALLIRGKMKYAAGDTQGALADLMRCIEAHPKHISAFQAIEGILRREGRIKEMIDLWSRHLEQPGIGAFGWTARARLYKALGDQERAHADFQTACERGHEGSCRRLEREKTVPPSP